MKINTNTWNKIRYTLYTPVYDSVAKLFSNSRRKSIEMLSLPPGEKVLIVGAGTGLDLEFMNTGCEIFATDITSSMVNKILARNKRLNLNLKAQVMDGHHLELADNSFDKIVLHLILAVIPDPVKCIRECERVLKPGGAVMVFDKFAPVGKVSVMRRLFNPITNFLFSDITRSFESIAAQTQLKTEADIKADLNGQFRIIKLVKLKL